LYGCIAFVMFLLWIVPAWGVVQFLNDLNKRTLQPLPLSSAVRARWVRRARRRKSRGKPPGQKIYYASNHTSYSDVCPLMLGAWACLITSSRNWNRPDALNRTFLSRWAISSLTASDPRNSRWRQRDDMGIFLRDGEAFFVVSRRHLHQRDGVRAGACQRGAVKEARFGDRAAPIIPGFCFCGGWVSCRDSHFSFRAMAPFASADHINQPSRCCSRRQSNPRTAAQSTSAILPAVTNSFVLRDRSPRCAIVRHSGEPLL